MGGEEKVGGAASPCRGREGGAGRQLQRKVGGGLSAGVYASLLWDYKAYFHVLRRAVSREESFYRHCQRGG